MTIKTTLKATACRIIGFEIRATITNDKPQGRATIKHYAFTRTEALSWMAQYPASCTICVAILRHGKLESYRLPRIA